MPFPLSLAPLTKLLEKDQPKVLAVVGAGVSRGATGASHASWVGLLEHGIDFLVNTEVFTKSRGDTLVNSLRSAFDPFDLKLALQHAENVEINLKTPSLHAFADWLERAFRDFRLRTGGTETLDALRDLQQAGALLVTTNYDSLLSQATGPPPVTWEEHADFLQVINRQRDGILHVHGHWQRPSSVVLGRSSYDRVVKDEKFQAAFKSLWLEWSWVYVGCGDGLDDPNLGRLLEWGKQWGHGALPDYFLAKEDKASALNARPDKPINLVCVGFPDYRKLPDILRAVTPAARCSPFVRVDDDFALFRSPGSAASIPFPSRQEYLDGNVPAFSVDAEVRQRFDKHGWAFVLDVASVGKTTLALRIATQVPQRDHPAFYLDLASIYTDDGGMEAVAALRRLSRPDVLLIIDNVHHRPVLARQLWDQWRDHPHNSRALLIGTYVQRAVITAPAQDLAFFEHHPSNPAVGLRPEPKDLKHIMQSIYKRFVGRAFTAVPEPPQGILREWHKHYGNALGAFCTAVLSHLKELQRGNWPLPLSAAADWVREKWLERDPLDSGNRENLLCLAVFAAQGLEMVLQNEALTHPGETDQLLKLGLVLRTEGGLFGQNRRFSLRDPGWGQLILAAQRMPINLERVLFETAARYPVTATILSSRLRREGNLGLHTKLWAHLTTVQERVATLASELPITSFRDFINEAVGGQTRQLVHRCWEAIESDLGKFAEHAWETPLHFVALFLDTAKRHGRNTDRLWQGLERKPAKFAECALNTSLEHVAHFLATAKQQGRNTEPLWQALEGEPAKLVERAWETSLHFVALFLDTAKRHGRHTEPLWQALESEPAKLAERAWAKPFDLVASFLDTAKRHGRHTEPLWQALESEPAKFAECAWETQLGNVASFLQTAKRHGRHTEPLWQALESESAKFAECASHTSLEHVAHFLATAKQHGRNAEPLWQALESEPAKFVERAWATPLEGVAHFLTTAKQHGRNTEPLWQALESEPTKFAERAWATRLDLVASFLGTAKRHGRHTEPLWQALEREPAKLVERAWATPLESIAHFLTTAKQHGRNTEPLWQALESEPAKFAERAWNTSLGHVAHFLTTAKQHGRHTEPLWQALEVEPVKLAERAWATPLDLVASFLDTAKRHGRHTEPLWQALEGEPAKLAERAWATPLQFVALFLDTAKQHGRNTERLWQALESEPAKLAERVWATPLEHVAHFLATAKQHGRNTEPLWQALEGKSGKFAERAWNTSLGHVAHFLTTAKQHGRHTEPLWQGLEGEPAKLAERAWATPLHFVASFLDTAKRHGRHTEPLWQALESEPAKLAQRARETPLEHVAHFLATAKQHGRNIAPL